MMRSAKFVSAALAAVAAIEGAEGLKASLRSSVFMSQPVVVPATDANADALRTLNTLDSNHDGFVDKNEVAAFANSQGLDAASAIADFAALDLNGDGRLNAAELSSALGPDSDAATPKPPTTPQAATPRPPAPPAQMQKATTEAREVGAQRVVKKPVAPAQDTQVKQQQQQRIVVQPKAPQQKPQAPEMEVQQPEQLEQEPLGIPSIEDVDASTHASVSREELAHMGDGTAAMALEITDVLQSQQKAEAEANQLDFLASQLRANLTRSAQTTALKARQAAQKAANAKATTLMEQVSKLETQAQKAEVAAAALRAKAKAELEQADQMMEVANAALTVRSGEAAA